MRYELRINAYDCMDMIQCTLTVSESDGRPGSTTTTALHMVAGINGRGESDARDWAMDVLSVLRHRLSENPPESYVWGVPSGGVNTISGVADSGN
jgi:hypothetical protein